MVEGSRFRDIMLGVPLGCFQGHPKDSSKGCFLRTPQVTRKVEGGGF